MNKLTFFFSSLFVGITAFSQTMDSNAKKYAETITADELKEYVYQLASDEFEGRETGKKGQKLAADYLAKYFENIGIKPFFDNQSYFQTYNLKEESAYGVDIYINQVKYEFMKDFYHFSGFQNQTIKDNEILFLGYGIESENYNDYKDINVEGKVLLILDDEPHNKEGKSLMTEDGKISDWSSDRWKKINLAQKKGAKAVFIISKSFDYELRNFSHYIEKPMTYLKGKERTVRLPYFFISPQMAEKILVKKTKKDLNVAEIRNKISVTETTHQMSIKLPVQIKIEKPILDLTAENVLAYIPGTDLSEEVLILTAHYDHLGIENGEINYGADDDGSGTAALMEIAEAFVKAKNGGNAPRRSILIMPVSGEEKGLLGSSYYVDNPVIPLNQTIANLNIDMIGRLDESHQNFSNYVYLIGSDKLSTELHQISENVNKTCCNITLDYTFNNDNDPNRFYYRSDHYNFAKNNIPVIFYFTGVHEDYHKPTDTADKIDYQKMENITRLVFYTAWELANRDTAPKLDN